MNRRRIITHGRYDQISGRHHITKPKPRMNQKSLMQSRWRTTNFKYVLLQPASIGQVAAYGKQYDDGSYEMKPNGHKMVYGDSEGRYTWDQAQRAKYVLHQGLDLTQTESGLTTEGRIKSNLIQEGITGAVTGAAAAAIFGAPGGAVGAGVTTAATTGRAIASGGRTVATALARGSGRVAQGIRNARLRPGVVRDTVRQPGGRIGEIGQRAQNVGELTTRSAQAPARAGLFPPAAETPGNPLASRVVATGARNPGVSSGGLTQRTVSTAVDTAVDEARPLLARGPARQIVSRGISKTATRMGVLAGVIASSTVASRQILGDSHHDKQSHQINPQTLTHGSTSTTARRPPSASSSANPPRQSRPHSTPSVASRTTGSVHPSVPKSEETLNQWKLEDEASEETLKRWKLEDERAMKQFKFLKTSGPVHNNPIGVPRKSRPNTVPSRGARMGRQTPSIGESRAGRQTPSTGPSRTGRQTPSHSLLLSKEIVYV